MNEEKQRISQMGGKIVRIKALNIELETTGQ